MIKSFGINKLGISQIGRTGGVPAISDPQYRKFTDGTTEIRIGIRNCCYVKDITISELGFDGIEYKDWENIENIVLWSSLVITNITLAIVSQTEQTITVSYTGQGEDGVSFEYSLDGLTNWTVAGTSINKIFNATGLTENYYYWRARIFKGSIYGPYSTIVFNSAPMVLYNTAETVGWYEASDLSSITKNGSNIVSQWNDKLGSGHNLASATGPIHDATEGMIFNNQYLRSVFPLNQPVSIYIVIKLTGSDFANAALFDGTSWATGLLHYHGYSQENLQAYAGYDSPVYTCPTNQWFILRMVFNGGNTYIGSTTPAYGPFNSGSNNPGGITLGRWADLGAGGKFNAKEVIWRNHADPAGTEFEDIYNYLKAKYSL